MAEYEKVSVTLPKDLMKSIRTRAGTGGVSAYIAERLLHAERMAALDEFLAWSAAEYGPIPDEIMEEVRRAWPDPRAAAKPPRRPPVRRSSSTAKD
jgi:hypothetical protein